MSNPMRMAIPLDDMPDDVLAGMRELKKHRGRYPRLVYVGAVVALMGHIRPGVWVRAGRTGLWRWDGYSIRGDHLKKPQR